MWDNFLEAARALLTGMIPVAVVFGLLALVMKRRAVLAGLKRARNEIVTNLYLLLVNALVVAPLLAVPLMTGHDLVPRNTALVALWDEIPVGLSLIAAIVVIDFAAYWRHRAEHSRSVWPIHATHHADEAMNWLSLHRKHPLGAALSMAVDTVPVLLLGLPFWAIAAALVLRTWWGYFVHADVPWTLGPVGKVLISPAAHRLHHIRDEELMGFNYGNTITLWDKLFGTYVDPAPYLDCETGIAEGTRDFIGELARPFEARYRPGKGKPVGNQPAL
ncbi:sterol desaturase family protein [Erythrobacter sp. sf7]|uniref:Sterol desaturase family protein n=1 Tax=Erythrobacter fulvus TaxID=2987523 RepID=A0ABT5JN69_9SPHN|nr:sterol desaturase family protein [Erythrobacter fulvus]MDC8753583.1 sterol desaturase family protein [Erythrobacter fulvus]